MRDYRTPICVLDTQPHDPVDRRWARAVKRKIYSSLHDLLTHGSMPPDRSPHAVPRTLADLLRAPHERSTSHYKYVVPVAGGRKPGFMARVPAASTKGGKRIVLGPFATDMEAAKAVLSALAKANDRKEVT